ALNYSYRWVGSNFLSDTLTNQIAGIQLLGKPSEGPVVCISTQPFDGNDSIKGIFNLIHFAGVNSSDCHLRYQPFQIANLPQLVFKVFVNIWIFQQELYCIKTVGNRADIL